MIPVLWHAPERMSYSCCASLNMMFDSYPVEHFTSGVAHQNEGAVIVFHGENRACELAAEELNRWAANRPWTIFVSVGDEGCIFPYSLLKHKNMRLWCQTPKPGKVTAHRYLLEGAPADCRPLLDAAGDLPRSYDWVFAGQINHWRRQRMQDTLRTYPHGPHMIFPTQSFGAGLPHNEYYAWMKRAKVVPCPSGLATPDSFRFAEALEAGAIPVVDACAPDGVMGYWRMVLGNDHPFVEIEDWATFPEVCSRLLSRRVYKHMLRITQAFWKTYKLNFSNWLTYDIAKLGGFK